MFESYKEKSDGIIHYYDLKRRSNRAAVVLIYIFMILLSIIFLYPIFWLCFAIFKDAKELKSTTRLLPYEWRFDQLRRSWKQLQFGKAYFYSFYSAIGAVIVSVLFNGMFGYVLSVMRPRGTKIIWGFLMGIMLVPATCNFVVLYRYVVTINNAFGLKASFWPMILGSGASAFNVMMFKTFFDRIPRDYIDAARIDGASHIQIFFRIIVPLSKPIITVVAINTFIGEWSNFLMPYLLLGNSGKETVMVKLYEQTGQSSVVTTQLRAAMFAIIVPIVVFCIFQKQIMDNDSSAGLKG